MQLNGMLIRTLSIFTLLASPSIFANTNIVGGFIPSKGNFTVIPNSDFDSKKTGMGCELATIEIDNNLSTYELVLDFSELESGEDLISEVRLQEVSGNLGQGLVPPSEGVLIHEEGSGRFVWKPGIQQSPTQGYQMRVFVTFKKVPKTPPQLTVSMPYYL